jgi:beta-lactamase superfamily II metal-dependent hydrolase
MAKVDRSTHPMKQTQSSAKSLKEGENSLRIRMYRVGFGDFFLITGWSKEGPQHILIDCGVTRGKTGKGDIATIKTAVRHMAKETDNKLALIVVTHRHQDHIIGFSRCEADFERFAGRVDAIWMPYWETEYPKVQKFQEDIENIALGLRAAALAGDRDAINEEILGIAENATGVSVEGPGGGTNRRSLDLLKNRLGVGPQYYAMGNTPELPKGLVDAGFSAKILGPPPATEFDFLKLMDLTQGIGQYMDANGPPSKTKTNLLPFGPEFVVGPEAYPATAFREWAPRVSGKPPDLKERYAEALERAVRSSTPNALLMAARKLDGILNNQSLVVLFNWKGKPLLFAGDAQAGNWLYWLYDLDKPTKKLSERQLADEGRAILGSLAFYKMGHHGSTNATPIAAVGAMGEDFVTMCSTQEDTFGTPENDSEVPRIPLISALAKKSVVIRSDYYVARIGEQDIPAAEDAPATPPKPKVGRLEVHDFYVDYFLRA